ncbi:hypothetical protein SAMN05216282_11170 [Cryobacterium psychrotolerans]|uniref:Fe-S oxidoreductase n=1 Tax=Cryobacterium psychrotolerans TaxID=386301 RepID=A0A1G9E8C6_9MICO|nr:MULTISPECIES: hypothetical protein [Cryobacterium]TFD47634.1 hypothetical protein E3T33_02430 [Cryobacterium sp. TMT1-2-1]TFD86389.1 hypothetical protein E3T56_07315 [Cryobacterium psychrotolerans]SDK72295.1 hypothetical protein SAMN05216282_11170 [Cryobacterium psychrotolerans]
MQLGTRWSVGAPVPAGLPHVVEIAVKAVEEELVAVGEETGTWRWTLTWLESKPVIELDDGTVIRYNPGEDSATITQPVGPVEDDEDWI